MSYAVVDKNTGEEVVALVGWRSESIEQLAEALATAQGEIGHASKNSTNPHFRNKYADLAEVIDTCRPVLSKNGLSVVQRNVPADGGVLVKTMLIHKSGEWLADDGLFVPASKQDAQGFGSALTYARRYGLSALVGIAPDEDDDGNAAAASAPAARRAAPRKPEAVLTGEQLAELEGLGVKAGLPEAEAKKIAAATKPNTYERRKASLVKRAAELADGA